MADAFEKRIEELCLKTYNKGVYSYTDFLSPSQIETIKNMKFNVPFLFYGGAEFCERCILRFGSEETLGYAEEFPIKIIFISARGEKFAKPVTHRDFLGAVLNLGIERDKVGDIFTDGKNAYVAVSENLAEFILQNLIKVGGNAVQTCIADSIPDSFAPQREVRKINVSSPRIDAVLCKLYKLSRDDGAAIVKEGRVNINGRQIETPSYSLKNGETVSVRGYGKFIFSGELGETLRGRKYVEIEVYK